MKFVPWNILAATAMLAALAIPSNAGLVAHYRFNDTLDDETGAHNGTTGESPAFDTGVAGNALVLGSPDTIVDLSNPQSLEFGKDFTVAAWVQTTHPGEEVVIYRGDPDHFVAPALQFNVQAAKIFLYGADQGNFGSSFPGVSINDGEWHHLAISFSAASTPHLTLYLDGQAKRPGNAGAFGADYVPKTNAPNSVVRLGGRDAESADYRFRGLLDEVQMYDRALGADEVQFLFKNPGEVVQPPAIPVIRSQPVTNQTVALGGTVSFSVVAEARTPLTYQWQLNGVNVTNATNPTLTLTNVTEAQAGQYTVIITSAAGSVTSEPAVLSVAGAPELDLHMYAGLTIVGKPGLQYQIEYRDALSSPNAWMVLTNISLPESPFLFFDIQSTNAPKRFYRAATTP